MTASRPEHGVRATASPTGSDEQVARRSRIAGGVLVLILLVVSVFAVWSSQLTSAASSRAVAAIGLSDDYAEAAGALAAQESLDLKYRMEPGPEVRSRYGEVAAVFVAALGRVRQDGDGDDRVLVTDLLAQHEKYVESTERLFVAVDRGDTTEALRIARKQTEPAFESIKKAVLSKAHSKHTDAVMQLRELDRVEGMTAGLTPGVFLSGLLLAAVLASITRGHRRQLDAERTRAVHDSLHDDLTGLPNRALLADRLTQALRAEPRSGTTTGLLLIDLDRFKEINDTFGHHYGDELLAQVGPRLVQALRDDDTVSRLGGDEFAVLLPDVPSVSDALVVATKLQAALEKPFRVAGVDLDVEASVGVVLSGEHGRDASTLLQRADIAMYVAKSQNLGVFAYNPDIDQHSPAKLALLGDLRRALERGELVLQFQPKISLSTGEVVGSEALMRWQHPVRGMVFPDDFLPLAEHTGLIGPITRHVLDTALAQVRSWADAGQPLSVSVNLSARNLLDERLPDVVAQLLEAHGVSADLLELEITESALMTEPVRAQQLLKQLSELGVRISIDDFGAGYTSLGQLKNLPVAELKIDRSFVRTMTVDRSNAVIVESVIDLGHNLGLSIVAEGVETEEAMSALRGFGCDVAQGYHFAQPMDALALTTWLEGQRIAPLRQRATTTRRIAAPARPIVPG